MEGSPNPANPYGTSTGGVRQSDVSHAADALLRDGNRPTVEKIRTKLGRGSPNTINPLLDAWWKTLSARLDSGPAALHRLPETVAHVAEALWMQALEEGRRRSHQELKTSEHLSHQLEQNLEVRSHVLTLREGELDSRLRDRDRTIEELNLRLRELTCVLRKEQATRESLTRRHTTPVPQILARDRRSPRPARTRTPPDHQRKQTARRAAPLRSTPKRKTTKRTGRKKKKAKRR